MTSLDNLPITILRMIRRLFSSWVLSNMFNRPTSFFVEYRGNTSLPFNTRQTSNFIQFS